MPNNICQEKNFQTIYRNQAESLRNFLYYKLGDFQQAEDLTQEAFGKLWVNCAKVVTQKAKAYLFTIGKNLFLNQLKHQKIVFEFEDIRHRQESNLTPQFLLEEEEFRQRLQSAISDLPEGQRLVFLMSRIDKKRYSEIAKELEISVKAVEKRMHHALVSLRKISKNV